MKLWVQAMSCFLKLDIKKSKTGKRDAQPGLEADLTASISAVSTGNAPGYVYFSHQMCKAHPHTSIMRLRDSRMMHSHHSSSCTPNSFAMSPFFNFSMASLSVIEGGDFL